MTGHTIDISDNNYHRFEYSICIKPILKKIGRCIFYPYDYIRCFYFVYNKSTKFSEKY